MSYRVTKKSLVSFFIKSWILILSYQLLKRSSTCFVLANFNEQKLKENDKVTDDGFLDTMYEEFTPHVKSNRSIHSCKYYKLSKRLLCTGSIDYDYLKKLRKEEINVFMVENYEVDSLHERKYWLSDEAIAGEKYSRLPNEYQLLKGKVYLKDLGLLIESNVRIFPKRNKKGFLVEGEAFSNKIIKLSWRLKGNMYVDVVDNKTMISLDADVIGGSKWRLQNNVTFWNVHVEDMSYFLWIVEGKIKSNYSVENQFAFYEGTVLRTIENEECKFQGELRTRKGNLEATVSGSVSKKRQRKQVTIPESAFSNMTIKNIVFKDSTFYNDFDKNSFQGLRGLKSISFTESKLEVFPRLNKLFQYLYDLEEIYIEDCRVPQLKFGIMAVLEKVRTLSFKGSGPLYFDDTSFLWLKNSRLESLDLQQSHVKISFNATGILRSVKKTLQHLDISGSTLNGERELNVILKDLNIETLKAESLNLNKIPTNALANVAKSLRYLSLRDNDFRKHFGKDMFNTILNFPFMVKLEKLDLSECHINYIEKGTFDNLPNLEVLHLGYNKIENLQDGWMYVAPKVKHLSLVYNDIIPRSIDSIGFTDAGTSINLSGFRDLEVLDLANGIFRETDKLVSGLGGRLRVLSLRNTRLEDIPDNFFDNLIGLEILDLSYNRDLKPEESFSFEMFKNLNNLKFLSLRQCKITIATAYNGRVTGNPDSPEFALNNLMYLDLSGNNFKILDFKVLKVFPNVRMLDLSENSITEWRTKMFVNEHLETVYLDENKIQTITEEMLSDIRSLKEVKLGRNPFICGLYVYQIIKMNEVAGDLYKLNKETIRETEDQEGDLIKKALKIKNNQVSGNESVKFVDWFENNYICYSWSQEKFLPFTQVNEDFGELSPRQRDGLGIASVLWTGIIFLGVAISFATMCWKFLDIHLITRAVRNAVALSFIGRNEKGVTHFKYNVFVSYSDKDRPWVVENLLPRLESRCEEQSVCLHERDFQVGLSIIENILNSIESSKNIILVVSQAFLKSQWCQYEMQLAQFRLLEKGRHQLILIFLENIPAIKRPKTLRYLMMTKTYLEWPLNPTNRKAIETFWNRLIRSLEN